MSQLTTSNVPCWEANLRPGPVRRALSEATLPTGFNARVAESGGPASTASAAEFVPTNRLRPEVRIAVVCYDRVALTMLKRALLALSDVGWIR